jgi:hypothetical protein
VEPGYKGNKVLFQFSIPNIKINYDITMARPRAQDYAPISKWETSDSDSEFEQSCFVEAGDRPGAAGKCSNGIDCGRLHMTGYHRWAA